LKILHLSESGLPDWRIEKAALTGYEDGKNEVFFCGYGTRNYKRDFQVFSRIYEIKWTDKAMRGFPFYQDMVKKQIKKIINEIKPDIIHAHNIFAAKVISDFDIPFVFDNHEFWKIFSKVRLEKDIRSSNNIKYQRNPIRKILRNMLLNYSANLWVKWEADIIRKHPTITVSDTIADELKKIGNTNNVFVVPNFPMQFEIKDIQIPEKQKEISLIYAGADKIGGKNPTFRDFGGLAEVIDKKDVCKMTFIGVQGPDTNNIRYTGFIPRTNMFNEMTKHSIGLIPWKKHWAHKYLNPNKYAEYAHTGLFVMCTSSLETISTTLKDHCITFEDYEDLVTKIEYFKNNIEEMYNKRIKIYKFARENLLWERYHKNILDAYRICT